MSFVALAFAYLRRRWGQALSVDLRRRPRDRSVATAIVGFDALPQRRAVRGAASISSSVPRDRRSTSCSVVPCMSPNHVDWSQ